MWDDFTYLFPNVNYTETIEVCEWISDFIQHLIGHVATYPYWDES